MDLLDDDMGIWLLIFSYTSSGLLLTDIQFLMIFHLTIYNEQGEPQCPDEATHWRFSGVCLEYTRIR